MADFPAMPLWTDAYLADTRHLSDAEHGRYLLMLMDMWRMPGCRFPNDGEWLCRRFRRTPEEFAREIQPLLDEFCQCDGNWWTQKRLAREWHRLRGTSQKQSVRAKARWDKEKGRCHGNASAAMPYPQPQPQPESPKTPPLVPPQGGQPNGASKPKRERRKPATPLPEDWRPDVEYARRQGMHDREINLQANKLVDWAKAGDQRCVDWTARWRNWVRSYMERKDGRPGFH